MLKFELENGLKPVVATMGPAFKPNIDDLRDAPVKYICNNAELLIVEPNVKKHNVFKLTDYKEAFGRADIMVYLVAHHEFKTQPRDPAKIILDFCGIYKDSVCT